MYKGIYVCLQYVITEMTPWKWHKWFVNHPIRAFYAVLTWGNYKCFCRYLYDLAWCVLLRDIIQLHNYERQAELMALVGFNFSKQIISTNSKM